MTAHTTGKWGRAIGSSGSAHVAFVKAWCYLCDAPHGYDECPLTKEQKEQVMLKRRDVPSSRPKVIPKRKAHDI